jgi:hypothetical protein
MMTQRTLLTLSDWRPVCDIKKQFEFRFNYRFTLTPVGGVNQATDWKIFPAAGFGIGFRSPAVQRQLAAGYRRAGFERVRSPSDRWKF